MLRGMDSDTSHIAAADGGPGQAVATDGGQAMALAWRRTAAQAQATLNPAGGVAAAVVTGLAAGCRYGVVGSRGRLRQRYWEIWGCLGQDEARITCRGGSNVAAVLLYFC
jgi:hypothetical protein